MQEPNRLWDDDESYIRIRLKKTSLGILSILKGGEGSGIHGHTTDRESSSIHSSNPADLKIVSASKEEKVKILDALKYLDKKDIKKECTIEASNLGTRYGLSKGDRLYIDSDTIKTMPPVFIAAIIFHEGVHSSQDYRKMDSNRREFQARFQTKFWASRKVDKEGITTEEKVALKNIIKDQTTA